ncbi:MAG: hypothetical protein P1V20_16925, partial [Verrucomicrobiales bacterium]|nr:hypothetical protein [Verrucomicrobiales bacterium]
EALSGSPASFERCGYCPRVIEYLGGDSLENTTCSFIASCDSKDPRKIRKHPLDELDYLLDEGTSLARSLEDSESVLMHLDIEYVNFDDPASPFTDPWHAFSIQQPVVNVIEELLVKWGIRPLHLITGRGHHFVWRVPKGSASERELADLVIPNQTEPGVSPAEIVFDGTTLIMEYFANEIRSLSTTRCEIPVEMTAVHVGPGRKGIREMVSIDISEYGDPLSSRMIRIPFTAYRKPWMSGMISEMGLEGQIGHFVTLPLHEMDAIQCIKCRQDIHDIASLAKCASVIIPDQESGTRRLIQAYRNSTLRQIHAEYYEDALLTEDQIYQLYGDSCLSDVPGCVVHAFLFPNEILLKPAMMQLVTRCLLANGMRSRHIAGVIAAKFSNPCYNWGSAWENYSPQRRAEFYVRLFSSQIALGNDPLIDFNCMSQQEKGFCWPSGSDCNLNPWYRKLKSRPI